jgi:prevent-host-death family protein
MTTGREQPSLEQIGVRDLRQQASRYLRRVEAGESFLVTDYGRPVAVLASTMESVRAASDAVLEALVATGAYPSVEDAVAASVEELTRSVRERLTTDLIIAGYRRAPQTDDELAVAHAAGVRAIAAEPW